MAEAPRGAMLALSASEAQAEALTTGRDASVATVNGPRQCVVAGTDPAIATIEADANAQGVTAQRLNVSHAFHCALMDPVLEDFGNAVSRTALRAPVLPFLSNVTGDWATTEDVTDPRYWVRHLRGTVRFADNLARLLDAPGRVLVEAGPGQTLTRLARVAGAAPPQAIAALGTREAQAEGFLEAVGRLWLSGVEPDWDALHRGTARHRIALPAYPFRRTRHWVDAPNHGGATASPTPLPAQSTAARGNVDVVAEVWQEVMGVPDIAPDADFFALGGDSMVALRIMSRLRERLGVQVPVAAALRHPTVRGLAALLDELTDDGPAAVAGGAEVAAEREVGVL